MESVPETQSEPAIGTPPQVVLPTSSSSSAATTALSPAQLRQERIRRKVLANQGERLKTVLGPSATDDDIKNLLKSQLPPEDDSEPRSRTATTAAAADESSSSFSNLFNGPDSSGSNATSTLTSDQIAIKPLISVSMQRYVFCLVGALLSLLTTILPSTLTSNWNFLVYFAVLELIIWGFVKRGAVTNSSNSTLPLSLAMFLLLINKPGLKDPLKLAYDLWSWLWIDLCCFLTSIFVVQLIFIPLYLLVFLH